MEAEVTGGEIELLVVSGVVGDVHLVVFAGDGAVALNDHCRVVVEACCALLEKGGDDDDIALFGNGSEELCRWAGNGLGEVEEVDIFRLTEIKTVVQFLEDDELGTLIGEGSAFGGEPLLVVFFVGGVMLLDDSYF
jgi:hypothetical protein